MAWEIKAVPKIIAIRDLKNVSDISEMAHDCLEPIFVTKDGHIDFVVMSAELYETIMQNDRIDQSISDAEAEMGRGGRLVSLEAARARLGGAHQK